MDVKKVPRLRSKSQDTTFDIHSFSLITVNSEISFLIGYLIKYYFVSRQIEIVFGIILKYVNEKNIFWKLVVGECQISCLGLCC